MNFCLLRCLHLVGASIQCEQECDLPSNIPYIFVANHQSMFDVPLISWYLRHYTPKFISKKELGKGIPSISFNLRNGGHALIDRSNPKQSITEISKFGKYLYENNFSAVIFPEGTRSKDGKVKEFATTGLRVLFKNMPKTFVVPITINNSWRLVRSGDFPLGIGIHLSMVIHKPMPIHKDPELLIDNIKERIIFALRA